MSTDTWTKFEELYQNHFSLHSVDRQFFYLQGETDEDRFLRTGSCSSPMFIYDNTSKGLIQNPHFFCAFDSYSSLFTHFRDFCFDQDIFGHEVLYNDFICSGPTSEDSAIFYKFCNFVYQTVDNNIKVFQTLYDDHLSLDLDPVPEQTSFELFDPVSNWDRAWYVIRKVADDLLKLHPGKDVSSWCYSYTHRNGFHHRYHFRNMDGFTHDARLLFVTRFQRSGKIRCA